MPAMDYERIARWYDAYVDTTLDVPFFLQHAQQAAGPVLELMSGTGRVSMPLLRAGVDLTCVDSSPAMLAVFRDKLRRQELAAELIEVDVCALELGRRFAMIFIPFHSFAEIADGHGQRGALRRIRAHLADNGRFICTLHNPAIRLRRVDGNEQMLGVFPRPDGPGTLRLSSVERCEPGGQIVTGTQVYEVLDDRGQVVSRQTLDLRWFVHRHAAFAALVESVGYQTVALYGDYEGAPFQPECSPFMIWVLQ